MKRLLFNERPEGTKYTPGMWSWVKDEKADQYVIEGLAEVYNPQEKPTMDNTKDEIISYLESKGLEFSESQTKSELLELTDG